MPFSVTDIQPTPNPNAMKYVLDTPISPGPLSFFNPDAAKDHALATRLFQIDGVTGLLLLGDFVTVNKRPDASWPDVTKQVKKVLKAG